MDNNYILLILLLSIFTQATGVDLNNNTNFLLLLLLALQNNGNNRCCCNNNFSNRILSVI